MKFKGDIIITDPCYIMKKSKLEYPKREDYGIFDELYSKKSEEQTQEEKVLINVYSKAITEYYNKRDSYDDWSKCNYGDNMERLGIKTYLSSSTEYGDWSCTTVLDTEEAKNLIQTKKDLYFKFFNEYNFTGKSTEEKKVLYDEYQKAIKPIDEKVSLGNFCADAGLVAVFLLDEVLAYNPDFDYHINNPWTTTLIKNFDGDVEITHRQSSYIDSKTGKETEGEYEVSVIGKGNINFFTTQTGF